MLSFILGLIPGVLNTVNGITTAIANEKIAALNAVTDQERIAAQERVSTLQAQRDALIASTNRSSLDIWLRTAFAIGPLCYLSKIFIYDKVLSLGSTDPLDPHLWYVVMSIIGYLTVSQFRK